MEAIKLTCNKCEVEFTSRENANKHYSGKWHQFNIMKILKNMPILTEQNYEQLVNKSTFVHEVCVFIINNFSI